MWDAIVDRQRGFLNFTPELAQAMRRTRVAVLGTGGNGVVLDHLLRVGFERFVLMDPDVVEDTNLNRLPFTTQVIGLPKVEAWRRYLTDVNPECLVEGHQCAITRHDGPRLAHLLSDVDLVFAGTTSVEANIVIGRICADLKKRMIVGPASSGSWVVSTFTHENDVTLESVAGLGTEGQALEDIDYQAAAPGFLALANYPGRRRKYAPDVRADVLSGKIGRSCKIFVSLTNAAMAFEAVKNVAVLNGLPLRGTAVTAMPVFHVFDPYSGCAYYVHVTQKRIGIPDWLTGEIRWAPYPEDERS